MGPELFVACVLCGLLCFLVVAFWLRLHFWEGESEQPRNDKDESERQKLQDLLNQTYADLDKLLDRLEPFVEDEESTSTSILFDDQ